MSCCCIQESEESLEAMKRVKPLYTLVLIGKSRDQGLTTSVVERTLPPYGPPYHSPCACKVPMSGVHIDSCTTEQLARESKHPTTSDCAKKDSVSTSHGCGYAGYIREL